MSCSNGKDRRGDMVQVGGQDLATHLLRTSLRRRGRTLTEITDWMRKNIQSLKRYTLRQIVT